MHNGIDHLQLCLFVVSLSFALCCCRPNTFTYNAVIQALAKSGEAGAAARAERVLQNMVNRHRNGGGDDVKPTTINFNTVLDAWAKSGGGRASAERAEEILEWMDRLHKSGNPDVRLH